MYPSRHTVTKYLSGEKRHGVIYEKLFKRLWYINDQLHEEEYVKSEIEQKELIIAGFFILHSAKMRWLERY